MSVVQHNPPGVFPPYRAYAHAVEVRGDSRLADPQYDEPNVQLRMKYLGTHWVALTVICSKLLDPRWRVEMEAMAAR